MKPVEKVIEKPKPKHKEEEVVKIETSKLDFDEKDFQPVPKQVVKEVAHIPLPVKKIEKKVAPKKEENTFEIETTSMTVPDLEAPKKLSK